MEFILWHGSLSIWNEITLLNVRIEDQMFHYMYLFQSLMRTHLNAMYLYYSWMIHNKNNVDTSSAIKFELDLSGLLHNHTLSNKCARIYLCFSTKRNEILSRMGLKTPFLWRPCPKTKQTSLWGKISSTELLSTLAGTTGINWNKIRAGTILACSLKDAWCASYVLTTAYSFWNQMNSRQDNWSTQGHRNGSQCYFAVFFGILMP